MLTPTVPITRAIPAVEENIPDEKIVCATVKVSIPVLTLITIRSALITHWAAPK